MWAYVSTGGLTRKKNPPCLVGPWQHTIKAFTPAMSGAASRRLKEERIRGTGEREERAECASRDQGKEWSFSFTGAYFTGCPRSFPSEVRSSPQYPPTRHSLYGYKSQSINLNLCVHFSLLGKDSKPVMSVFRVVICAFGGLSRRTEKQNMFGSYCSGKVEADRPLWDYFVLLVSPDYLISCSYWV